MGELEEASEVGLEVIAESSHELEQLPTWVAWTAVSTLIMALFSAIGALLAGITANEALLERTSETMQVINRDRDLLQVEILKSKHESLAALDKPAPDDEVRILANKESAKVASEEMKIEGAEIESTMQHHEQFAIGVTLLSIGITLSGMAVVSQRPPIWHVGLVAGTGDAGFVGTAIVGML